MCHSRTLADRVVPYHRVDGIAPLLQSVTAHRVYQISLDPGFEYVAAANGSLLPLLRALATPGAALPATDLECVAEDETGPLRHADTPWLGASAVAMRPEARDRLVGLLTECAIFGTTCQSGELAIASAPLVGGLDESASEISRYSDGRILAVTRYVLRASTADRPLFRLRELPLGPTFAAESFVRAYLESGLRGWAFEDNRTALM